MDELALIRSIQQDDNRNAFAFLVRRYQSNLRGYLFHLSRGRSDWADELAQETFLKAYRGIQGFKGEAKFSTWLFQIARHLYFDALKKRSGEMAEMEPTSHDMDTQLDVQRALALLAPLDREILLLSFVQGLSHAEIAEIAALPLGTLKGRIAQAKAKLADLLMEVPVCAMN